MDRAVQLVTESIARFEDFASTVERKFCSSIMKRSGAEHPLSKIGEQEAAGLQNISDRVRKFVENCKTISTGSLTWRYVHTTSPSLANRWLIKPEKSCLATLWSVPFTERFRERLDFRCRTVVYFCNNEEALASCHSESERCK